MNIALCTGGGDAPGLNAVIRGVVVAALNRGWTCVGIRDGFRGLLHPEAYPQGGLIALGRESVRGITRQGGTILGTTNREDPTRYPVRKPDGTVEYVDRCPDVVAALKANNIDALVSIGGDGSMKIAHALSRLGARVVGVPKTIDNDLNGTVVTFGYETAIAFATECLDRLHSTAHAHSRVMVVEVMGRHAGWIALESGLAATADVILIPEIPYKLETVMQKVKERAASRGFTIIVVAEGAFPQEGEVSVLETEIGCNPRLGGAAERLTQQIKDATGLDCRSLVLGHLLRGGQPTARDRISSLCFGTYAVLALAEGTTGVMVALDPPKVHYVPLAEATQRMKTVPLDHDAVITARELGTCFGD